MNQLLKNYLKNKKILITGHSGFKGRWLSRWLTLYGANVVGISLNDKKGEYEYKETNESFAIDSREIDVRNYRALFDAIEEIKPDIVFHMAAQALVRNAIEDPLWTYETNIMGTINLLESVKNLYLFKNHNINVVVITSDKCYENKEQLWGYRETDRLGGKDPYSSSKACAEIACKSYYETFFSLNDSNVKIATARAGNVLGGGDFSIDRIIPDIYRSLINKTQLIMRHPNSTRPWQFVLEPLLGYIRLSQLLSTDNTLNGQSFNFGPQIQTNSTVLNIVTKLNSKLGCKVDILIKEEKNIKEAGKLQLTSDKAKEILDWNSILNEDEMIEFIAEWYNEYLINKNKNIELITNQQLLKYSLLAEKRGKPWVQF